MGRAYPAADKLFPYAWTWTFCCLQDDSPHQWHGTGPRPSDQGRQGLAGYDIRTAWSICHTCQVKRSYVNMFRPRYRQKGAGRQYRA